MRRVLTIAVALATAVALFGGSASAQEVTFQLGRTDVRYFHGDVPANGEFKVAVAGELFDSDGDGTADALQGATRMTKVRNVLRLQVDSLSLERQFGGSSAWQVVARTANPSNSGAASSVLLKTPAVGFCEGSTFIRLYRIHQVGSVRWSDGTLGRQVQFSGLFRDRILNDDPTC
jgi:hypothetical protein